MVEELEPHTGCPGCRSKLLPEEDQPPWGTHAISRKYACGSQVVYVLGGGYWEWEDECPTHEVTDAEISDDN